MLDLTRKLAVVTGASTGIGLELAKLAAKDKYDLVIAADEVEIKDAADELKREGGDVIAVKADLSTEAGVDKLIAKIGKRPVAALMANAGRGLGNGFLDQDWEDARFVVDTNVIGTLYLIQKVGRAMRDQGDGKILITGSIAGYIPGSYQAVYNGTKAFLDSFSYALREELKDTGITVTCLMPGPTDTEFFERAELMDTAVGTDDKKADPAKVAKDGFDAMMSGEGGIVSGWKNKLQVAASRIVPDEQLAKQHSKMAAPGTAKE
ncbi:MAG: SDR family NAD(P)-dependent oxidoreductase [Pseudolabrys sp.]|nr:SDR family NAD(P)-dependent oxidoreductase [Pseudolabrys sp.]